MSDYEDVVLVPDTAWLPGDMYPMGGRLHRIEDIVPMPSGPTRNRWPDAKVLIADTGLTVSLIPGSDRPLRRREVPANVLHRLEQQAG